MEALDQTCMTVNISHEGDHQSPRSHVLKYSFLHDVHTTCLGDLTTAMTCYVFHRDRTMREAEANKLKLTDSFLELRFIEAITNNTKMFFGDKVLCWLLCSCKIAFCFVCLISCVCRFYAASHPGLGFPCFQIPTLMDNRLLSHWSSTSQTSD